MNIPDLQTFIPNLLFYGFSTLLILSATLVITLQHPVRSVLSLVVCFFAAAGLWLLLTAEFLALILILVYVGAVMTLFLFVIMTLNLDYKENHLHHLKVYLPLGLMISALLAGLLIIALNGSVIAHHPINVDASSVSNTVELGKVLYTQYTLPFEISAVILLAAMIAAISLTLTAPILKKKQQNIDEQIKVKKQDRVRLIK
jgi:NADH-quinone oxidoreductase subunit J